VAGERRRLAAILAADVVGYSRLVGADEEGTIGRLRAVFRQIIQPTVSSYHGRVFSLMGDGFLAEFPSAVEAVRCAAAIQHEMETRGSGDAADCRIRLRIGIHLGDVIAEGGGLLGDGVNIAARLEGIAEPAGVVVSAAVADAVRGRIALVLEDMGERTLKNIDRTVRAFRLAAPTASALESASIAPPSRAALALPDRPSLVVLPFQNISGDPEHEYFADGMVEDITTALSRFRGLFVIARNSAFTYKGRAVDVRQVGHDLGVRYVLEGSVRRAGGRVRITGQLVEAETGHHLWADRFDGTVDEVFDLQDGVTSAVAAAIEPRVQRAEIERAQRKPTADLTAYDLYLRALPHFHAKTAAGNAAALPLLEAAVARDCGFAQGVAMLARAIARGVWQGWQEDHRAARARSEALARQALAMDPSDPFVLAMSGYILAVGAGEHELGATLLGRALELNLNFAEGWDSAAWAAIWNGEPDEAIGRLETAERLDPLSPDSVHVWHGHGAAHFFGRRFEEAVAAERRSVARAPEYPAPRTYLIAALAALGELDAARHEAAALLRIQPNRTLRRTRETNPFRHAWMMDLYLDGLRRAGIPE